MMPTDDRQRGGRSGLQEPALRGWWLGVALVAALSLGWGSLAFAQDNDAQEEEVAYGWVEIFSPYGAQVTVNGKPYPRRKRGMKLVAKQRHEVLVRSEDKEKTYKVMVRPGERRIMMVDLAGLNTPSTPAPAKPSLSTSLKREPLKKKEEDGKEEGKLTVYSKPKGEVYVDGAPMGATTPMINRELSVGRHEVQVKWESGDMSEVKTIRIRKGSKLKLFFRDRNKKR